MPDIGDSFAEGLYSREAGHGKQAFARRYEAPGGSARPGAAPPAPPDRMDLFLKRLEELLLRNPGIPVLQPAYHESPFRAQQFTFFMPTTSILGGVGVWNDFAVPINGNVAVPEGMIGVVSYAFVTVDERSVVVTGAADFMLWRITVNGITVPGFGNLRPWQYLSHWQNEAVPTVFDVAGAANGFPGPCVVPIKLKGGDVVSLGIQNNGSTTQVRVTILGYVYAPSKQDSAGVR